MSKLQIGPGIHDITNEEYHCSEGISRSQLMRLKQSPCHFWYENINPLYVKPKPTDAMIVGSATHTAILEPQEFLKRYYRLGKIDRRTTKGKELYAKALEENADKEIITDEQYQEIQAMHHAVLCHPEALRLVLSGRVEKSIFWEDPDTGILCKVRPDIWHDNMIVDLKTSNNAAFKPFQNSAYSLGYHLQAAMIHEAFKHQLQIDMQDFIFLVIEKQPPYAIALYPLDESALELGISEFKQLLDKLKHCQDTEIWPSYETRLLTMPNYTKYEVVE